MTVAEAIKLLQDEDPNARLVVVLSRYRHDPLRILENKNQGEGAGFYDEISVAGKDTSYQRGSGIAVVLIADLDD
jgi:hypothetical protein